MSFTKLTYHIIFSTRFRVMSIDNDHERELYKYIWDYCKARNVFVHRLGGMPVHIHALVDIPPILSLSGFIQNLKAESSKFMRINPHFPHWNGWSEGYGAFTKSFSDIPITINYINNQKRHHLTKTFKEEYLDELAAAGFNMEAYDFNEI